MTKLNPPKTPEDRKKMEDYATWRYFGDTAKVAAQKAGVTHALAAKWELQEWWRVLIVDRIERQHVSKLVSKARRVVDNTIEAGLHPEATAKDRKLAFDAAKWMLERQDASFSDRAGVSQDLAGRNLAELSVRELRALAQASEAQLRGFGPTTTEPEFPEIEVLPARPEPEGPSGPPARPRTASLLAALEAADREFEES